MTTEFKILILNAPCNGYGDIMFAFKLYKILKMLYNHDVYIATPDKDKMIMLGKMSDESVILLTDKEGKHPGQCSKFGNLVINTDIIFNLILPAPIAWDFKFDLRDIKKLIPYATKSNTYGFSEYNDYLNKGFYFNTGIGKKRLGFLILPVNKTTDRLIKDKYALAYLNTIDSTTPRWRSCLKSFIEMITKKYHYNRFQLIVSKPMIDFLIGKKLEDGWYKDATIAKAELDRIVDPYYKNIILIDSEDARHQMEEKSNGNTFIIRGDILPVSNDKMLQYIEHSVNDVLITGDQSITDVLSCCPNKNIWYQIAPWKENLGSTLAKQMNNKYFRSKKTSCGTVNAKFTSNYKEFIKKNNFTKNFKPLMDEIIKKLIKKTQKPSRRRSLSKKLVYRRRRSIN